MKNPAFLLMLFASTLAAQNEVAPETHDASAPRVTISWSNPDTFSDLRSAHTRDAQTRTAFIQDMEKLIEREVMRRFDPAFRLEIEVTDVDLAGELRMQRFGEVRILRDIYPPRIRANYRVVDAKGSVVIEDRDRLILDSSFLRRGSQSISERFYYEKEMMRDWLRQTHRQALKAREAA